MKKNGTILYLEMLRCIALVLVVLVHVVAIPVQNWKFNIMQGYPFYSVTYAIGNSGVPLFLKISGTLLLNPSKEISLSKIYQNMIPRILLPLCIFGVVFAGLEIFFITHKLTLGMILDAMSRVINRQSWGHLWYLYMLLGIYIFLPVLKFLVNTLPEKLYLYITVILIVLGYIIPTINALLGTSISVNAPLPLCHLGSFWMGYLLIRYENHKRWNIILSVFGVISLVVVMVSGTISCQFGTEAYGLVARYDDLFVLGTTILIYQSVRFLAKKNRGGVLYPLQSALLEYI